MFSKHRHIFYPPKYFCRAVWFFGNANFMTCPPRFCCFPFSFSTPFSLSFFYLAYIWTFSDVFPHSDSVFLSFPITFSFQSSFLLQFYVHTCLFLMPLYLSILFRLSYLTRDLFLHVIVSLSPFRYFFLFISSSYHFPWLHPLIFVCVDFSS